MLRALFTGISGLTAHQQMLDVTANNIANVNTTGFKSSRTAFQDTLSQTVQGAAGARNSGGATPTPLTGGTNAIQIGLGVKLAGTEMNMGQGANQATGVGTDLMIAGDGFFTVMKNDAVSFTRSGAFHLDNEGHLATSDGSLVAGVGATWAAGPPPTSTLDPQPVAGDPTKAPKPLDLSPLINGYNATGPAYGTTKATGAGSGSYVSYTIDSAGNINAVRDTGAIDVLGQITMATFANPNGLQKVGNSQYSATASSGTQTYGGPQSNGMGEINAGYLEMSNVDLSAELTNLIIAQRGFQANSKSVTTADQILQTLVTLKQ